MRPRGTAVCAPAAGLALLFLTASAPESAGVRDGREWFVAPGGGGPGTRAAPFGRIQQALAAARPGDIVSVGPGVYWETLRSVRGGLEGAPIVVRAEGDRGSALVTADGRVLTLNHPHLVFDGLVFDGNYGRDDTVLVGNDASYLILRNCEVRRSSRDLVDIRSPQHVLIERCLIHRALNATGGRQDAHGIVALAVRDLTIRDTEIHTFSGDGFQADPRRGAPGWDRVIIEGSRIWLAPLLVAENGFAAGTVPGENAVDTKADAAWPRATLTIRDTEAWGFRGGLIGNMAAFNLKENVDVTVDRVTVWDSEIAFRLRGPTAGQPAGAHVAVMNTVIHDVRTAFRYENNIENLRIWNTTIGSGVGRAFQRASSPRSVIDVRNLLLLGPKLPGEAPAEFNLAVGPDAFADAGAHRYKLAPGSPAIEAGAIIAEVTHDRDGVRRPQGRMPDIGAYQFRAQKGQTR